MAIINKPPFLIHLSLENDSVKLIPLKASDFETLYTVAADPLIWKMHPNKNRYKRSVFLTFFEGALEGGGAFLIIDKACGAVAGGTRFYNHNPQDRSIFIGYTFYATQFWGKGLNTSAKKLMLDYVFQFVEVVYFHVGTENYRSQRAMERLGAKKINEVTIAYHGEPDRENFTYEIKKANWVLKPH